MRTINKIIWHCSASDLPDQCSYEAIEELHVSSKDKEFQWGKYKTTGKEFTYIGYQYLVSKEASIIKGRDEKIPGAHCYGHNSHSIGICLMGDELFPGRQVEAAILLTHGLMRKYGISKENVVGHYELANKTCPNLDMDIIRRNL